MRYPLVPEVWMLHDVLARLEARCRVEAPALLDDVRSAIDLAGRHSLALTLGDLAEPVALTDTWAPDAEAGSPVDAPPPATDPTERYLDLGPLGAGGMGEVRRVRDRELNRVVAMKLVHSEVAARQTSLARFVEEVQTTAQLQHPGIVPVYDAGTLPDGRVYFTMKEVRGRTLGVAIEEVHAASGERWETARSGWTFRRLVSALHQASLAVAFAHERGVVHRDLKPDNVMVGDFGEVQVMDWGLCKVLGRADLPTGEVVVERPRAATRMGQVMGTPAYMSPEQASGDLASLDARTDVYALGAMLYEVLSGRPPYEGPTGRSILHKVLAGPPPLPGRGATSSSDAMTIDFSVEPLDTDPLADPDPALTEPRGGAADLPQELVEACLKAMSRDPADRYPTARAFAAELEAWLEGSKKRERALEVVAQADATIPEAEALRERAATLAAEAEAELEAIPRWAPEDEKLASWAKQDEAAALQRQASLKSLERDQLLAGALTHVPDLAEAHAALAEDQRQRHEAAETARDDAAAARAEALLRSYANALPEAHPVRQRCAAYLKGTGAVTLVTDVEAEVELLRFEPYGRRLVARPVRSLGRTPLVELPLEMGSYLLLLQHPGRAAVRYPVHIGRGAHWDGIRPGATEPFVIDLPRADALGPDDCYVPAGWFQAGGDDEYGALPPGTRLWCDPFVMRRFPVTNREYIAFLDDLVAQGKEGEALRHAPRERGAHDEEGSLIYGRDAQGRFVLRPDADGDVWEPDYPVFMVDWFSATAFAAWHAARTGEPWRLPWDLEWEKAARGVDGRPMPWGDGVDPSFCAMRDSHVDRPLPAVVDRFPLDESVYGVRGLGGNVMDWCADVWTRAGPPLHDRMVVCHQGGEAEPGRAQRVHRGGHWVGNTISVRAALRPALLPSLRDADLGFRLARPWAGTLFGR